LMWRGIFFRHQCSIALFPMIWWTHANHNTGYAFVYELQQETTTLFGGCWLVRSSWFLRATIPAKNFLDTQ
jgi:hypothetical protein